MKKCKKQLYGIVLILAFAGPQISQVWAQTEPQHKVEKQEETRQFGAEAGEIVVEGQELMTHGQYDAALNKLSEAQSLDDLSAYEQSLIYQMQGSCFYELDQYREAITAFQKAIDADGLLKKERRALEFNIAQLLIASDQFEKGAILLEKWHRNGGQFERFKIKSLSENAPR